MNNKDEDLRVANMLLNELRNSCNNINELLIDKQPGFRQGLTGIPYMENALIQILNQYNETVKEKELVKYGFETKYLDKSNGMYQLIGEGFSY